MHKNAINIIGQRFTHLLVLEESGRTDEQVKWKCICDCGEITFVRGVYLRNGHTKSCGHLQKQGAKPIHGLSHKRFYNIYQTIRARCNNPSNISYIRYGEVGIKCSWNSFNEFKNDMYKSYQTHIEKFGEKQTQIDRIDNLDNYSKENCRWVTLKEQARNTSKNKMITFSGEINCINAWAEKFNVRPGTLWRRIVIAKWPIEKALTIPVVIGRNQFSK